LLDPNISIVRIAYIKLWNL